MSGPMLVRMLTIAQVAAMIGRSISATHKRLVALHAEDLAKGPTAGWLVRRGRGSKVLVNLQRLRAAHPVLFDRRIVRREEFEEVVARVERCESLLGLRGGRTGARQRAERAA